MLIDLNELFKKDNYNMELDLEVTLDEFSSRAGTFTIKDKTPLHLKLFHNKDKQFSVEGQCTLTIVIPCDRCLEDVENKFDISFSKEFDLEREESSKENESEEVKFITDDNKLLVDAILNEELLLIWPGKVLCKEDCKGLCHVCGHNLNVSDCGCDRVVLDPRMAAIQDIFKNSGN